METRRVECSCVCRRVAEEGITGSGELTKQIIGNDLSRFSATTANLGFAKGCRLGCCTNRLSIGRIDNECYSHPHNPGSETLSEIIVVIGLSDVIAVVAVVCVLIDYE